jgi:hypothetical protein
MTKEETKVYTVLEWKINILINGLKKIIYMTSIVESEFYEIIAREKIARRVSIKYNTKPISIIRVMP